MKERWVVLVGQTVRGKSKAPERLAGRSSWRRFKPYPYHDSGKEHEILYAKSFTATEEDALVEANRIKDSMFETYLYGMGKTDVYCVLEYKIILHNASENTSTDIKQTTDAPSKTLWANREDSKVTNRTLRGWGVIPFDPSTKSFKILDRKTRKIT